MPSLRKETDGRHFIDFILRGERTRIPYHQFTSTSFRPSTMAVILPFLMLALQSTALMTAVWGPPLDPPEGWQEAITPGFDPPIEAVLVEKGDMTSEQAEKYMAAWGEDSIPVFIRLYGTPAWAAFQGRILSCLKECDFEAYSTVLKRRFLELVASESLDPSQATEFIILANRLAREGGENSALLTLMEASLPRASQSVRSTAFAALRQTGARLESDLGFLVKETDDQSFKADVAAESRNAQEHIRAQEAMAFIVPAGRELSRAEETGDLIAEWEYLRAEKRRVALQRERAKQQEEARRREAPIGGSPVRIAEEEGHVAERVSVTPVVEPPPGNPAMYLAEWTRSGKFHDRAQSDILERLTVLHDGKEVPLQGLLASFSEEDRRAVLREAEQRLRQLSSVWSDSTRDEPALLTGIALLANSGEPHEAAMDFLRHFRSFERHYAPTGEPPCMALFGIVRILAEVRGDPLIPFLVSLAENSDCSPDTRRAAIMGLGFIGSEASVQAYVQLRDAARALPGCPPARRHYTHAERMAESLTITMSVLPLDGVDTSTEIGVPDYCRHASVTPDYRAGTLSSTGITHFSYHFRRFGEEWLMDGGFSSFSL